MVQEKSIALGLTLSYEPQDMLRRCLDMAQSAFGEALRRVLVINNTGRRLESRIGEHELDVLPGDDTQPIFVRMQRLVDHFLDHTTADAIIKIDPDTVVLRWDGSFPDLAGEMLHYHPRHQAQRWPHMPQWWQDANPDFIRPQYLHGIHGGYAWYSRFVCERLRPRFCGYDVYWEPDTLRTGRLKEQEGTACMIGEEQMFAWYMKDALSGQELHKDLAMDHEKYYTYRARVSEIPKPKTLAVFHPVKDAACLRQLFTRLGWSPDRVNDY